MALILTPVIVFVEKKIADYVGHDIAHKMKKAAMGEEDDGFLNIPTAG
jgi:queuosine precursor transporter